MQSASWEINRCFQARGNCVMRRLPKTPGVGWVNNLHWVNPGKILSVKYEGRSVGIDIGLRAASILLRFPKSVRMAKKRDRLEHCTLEVGATTTLWRITRSEQSQTRGCTTGEMVHFHKASTLLALRTSPRSCSNCEHAGGSTAVDLEEHSSEVPSKQGKRVLPSAAGQLGMNER